MLTVDIEKAQLRKTIRALNRCVEACTDGEKGYGMAAADVRSPTLKSVFRSYERQRADFVGELQRTIDGLGAWHENEGTARGTIHRSWTGARMALEGRKDEIILDECLRGETWCLHTYDVVLRAVERGLPDHVRALIVHQREAIAAALADMKNRLAFPDSKNPADLGARRS
jgi:uncharacterized protein (TIGR02284 family)